MSEALLQQFKQFYSKRPDFLGQVVGVYAPISGEIDCGALLSVMSDAGCDLALPYSEADGVMGFYPFDENDTEIGRYGIKVPRSRDKVVVPDCVVVPLVAVDVHGTRLGYGQGYYDRYLSHHPARTIGLAYEEQIVENLPVEGHDKSLDYVITPKRVIECV